MAQNDEFLRVKEAAEFLDVSPNTIRNWGFDGKIPEYRHPMNNYRLYRKADLQKVRRRLRQPIPVRHEAVEHRPH